MHLLNSLFGVIPDMIMLVIIKGSVSRSAVDVWGSFLNNDK